jgi:threonine dehydrogenase-like Zn-dependent dehydrogenase
MKSHTLPVGLTCRSTTHQISTLADVMPALVVQAEYAPRTPRRPGAMGKYRHVRATLVQQQVPQPGPGEVLVRLTSVAACGSDIHAVQLDADGYSCSSVPADGWHQTDGLRLGHEYAGVVVAVGPGVNPRWRGEAVTGDSLLPCWRCAVCRGGQPNHCPQARLLGLEVDGVFAEYAVVPASSLHRLEPLRAALGESALDVAALAEPLGVADYALRAALRCLPRRYPRSLLIRGGGPIGLLAGLVGLAREFHPIVVVEPDPRRLALASRLGLSGFYPTEVSPHTALEAFGPGATVVLDACGLLSPRDLLTGVRPGGVIVGLARTGRELCWPEDLLMTNGIRRVSVRGHVGCLPWVLRQLAAGRIDPRPLITRRLRGLDELADWLQHPERFSGEGKVLCRVQA